MENLLLFSILSKVQTNVIKICCKDFRCCEYSVAVERHSLSLLKGKERRVFLQKAVPWWLTVKDDNFKGVEL